MQVDCKCPGIYGRRKSLSDKEYLYQELIEWLRGKDLSVRQAMDLLEDTGALIRTAWHTEECNIKL